MLLAISPLNRFRVPAVRTALVVEDDPQLQMVMRTQLGAMGFVVFSASHFDGAIGHLTKCEPDVACIDVGLPSKSGYELCEHVRRVLGLTGLPIILTSESGSVGVMAHAEDAGANAFLHKPFSVRQLTHCVESLLGSGRWSAPLRHELQPRASRPRSTGFIANRGEARATLSAA
jgi:DNA-binding response OmpR family regulator